MLGLTHTLFPFSGFLLDEKFPTKHFKICDLVNKKSNLLFPFFIFCYYISFPKCLAQNEWRLVEATTLKIRIIVLIYYYFLEISYNRTGLLGSELLLILLFFYNWTIILNRTIILFLGLRYFSLYSIFESPEMIQKGRRKYYRFE